MKNSNLPETSELASKLGALVDGPIVFNDLDVVEDRTEERNSRGGGARL